MITFYPGPSKLYPEVREYLVEAFDSGILQMNHRSLPFMQLMEDTLTNFKSKMGVPEEYEVYFTSSATECWEILAQSVLRDKIQFCYNGAFGKKWFKYTVTNPVIGASAKIRGSRFNLNQEVTNIEIDNDSDFLCAVQNETSNGTGITMEALKNLPANSLKCFDITSSLGGENIDFTLGDFWFASVQKCMGLPAGMGILICSAKGMAKAEEVNERNHYNSLLFIQDNFRNFQTHFTPNILNIFLLNRLLDSIPSITEIDRKNSQRAKDLYGYFEAKNGLNPLIDSGSCRSKTVLSIESSPENIKYIKLKAAEKGIILGNGYGEWKESTFRIANFPAITDEEFNELKHFFDTL